MRRTNNSGLLLLEQEQVNQSKRKTHSQITCGQWRGTHSCCSHNIFAEQCCGHVVSGFRDTCDCPKYTKKCFLYMSQIIRLPSTHIWVHSTNSICFAWTHKHNDTLIRKEMQTILQHSKAYQLNWDRDEAYISVWPEKC